MQLMFCFVFFGHPAATPFVFRLMFLKFFFPCIKFLVSFYFIGCYTVVIIYFHFVDYSEAVQGEDCILNCEFQLYFYYL